MSDQARYYVLTNSKVELEGLNSPIEIARGEWWRLHGPIPAANGDAAIDKLRDMADELKADKSAEFVAVAATRFRRRRMRRQLFTRYALDDADVPDDPVPGEDPEQGQLT